MCIFVHYPNQMKTVFTFLFVILLQLQNARANNPLSKFYSTLKSEEKIVLLTLDLSGCSNCSAPMDRLINKLRSFNKDIPIYIVLNDSLTKLGEYTYCVRNNIDSNAVKFVYDESLHAYLITKTKGIPSISLISEEGKIECLKNLKTDQLDKLFELIAPDFKLVLNKKTPIVNAYTSLNIYNAILFYEKTFYVYVEGMNMISKYSKEGQSLGDFFIDSLNLNYFALAKTMFTDYDYACTLKYFEANKTTSNKSINPVSITKMGENLLGINIEIDSYNDSLYKKVKATFIKNYNLIVVVDTNFQMVNLLKFEPPFSQGIIFHSQGVYNDSVFTFLHYNAQKKETSLTEFKQKQSELLLARQYPEPHKKGSRYFLQMLSNVGSMPDAYYISYCKLSEKKSWIYKRNMSSSSFSPNSTILRTLPLYFYETEKGNFILWTDKKRKSSFEGYDTSRKKFVAYENKNPNSVEDFQNKNKAYFFKDGFLYEFSYTE